MSHLRSSEWRVDGVSFAEARDLVERLHYSHSMANTAVATHGIYKIDEGAFGRPYGVAVWMPPTPTAARAVAGEAWRGVLVLSRLVVVDGMPTNAASFLLGRSMRLLDRDRWPTLLTYADTRLGHTGAIYKATNWSCEGLVPAGDVWLGPDGHQRGRKRGPRNLTVEEMRSLGYERAPAAPKVRFVHRIPA